MFKMTSITSQLRYRILQGHSTQHTWKHHHSGTARRHHRSGSPRGFENRSQTSGNTEGSGSHYILQANDPTSGQGVS